jgi:hypothetical protein
MFQLRKSPTYDELAHLAAGVNLYRHLEFRQYHVNPPIAKLCFSPIAAISDVDVPKLNPLSESRNRPEMTIGDELLKMNQEQAIRQLAYARAIAVLLTSTGCVFVYLLLSHLYDPSVGVAGSVAWCATPMVIGHGSLITADVSSAVALVLYTIVAIRWISKPSVRSSLGLGCVIGVGLCTKYLLLITIVTTCIYSFAFLFSEIRPLKRVLQLITHLGITAFAALATVWVVFLGNGFGTHLSAMKFESSLMADIQSSVCSILSNVYIPLPKQYLQGIDTQLLDHTTQDDATYFLGTWHPSKPFALYCIGALMKNPVALMGLLALRFLDFLLYVPTFAELRKSFVLLAPTICLMGILEMQSQFQNPIRYAIPAVVLLTCWTLGLLKSESRRHRIWDRICRSTGYGLLLLYVTEGLIACRDPIAFVNIAFGGTSNGYKCLAGSNVEWGQNIADIARNQYVKGSDNIHVWITARDAVLDYYLKNHTRYYGNRYGFHGPDIKVLKSGYYVIEGSHLMDQSRASAFFRKLEPTQRIGSGYFMYRIPSDLPVEF